MTLYHATPDGYTGFDPLDVWARCPLCGRMFQFDLAGHVLNGGSLGDEPRGWPLCPDCAGDKHKEDNDNE